MRKYYNTRDPFKGRHQKTQRATMKTVIQYFYFALAILAGAHESIATTVFPIATNAGTVELAGGLAASGTNILVGYLSATNVCLQLISTNGSLIGSAVTNGV